MAELGIDVKNMAIEQRSYSKALTVEKRVDYCSNRLIFKEHLTSMFPQGPSRPYLSRRGVLVKDAGEFFGVETKRIKQHVKAATGATGRQHGYRLYAIATD